MRINSASDLLEFFDCETSLELEQFLWEESLSGINLDILDRGIKMTAHVDGKEHVGTFDWGMKGSAIDAWIEKVDSMVTSHPVGCSC